MHPFPPPPPFPHTRHEVLWMGLVVVVLAFAVLAPLLLRPRRKPHYYDPLVWIAAGIVLTALFSSVSIQVPGIHFVRDSLFMMTWVMVVWGGVLSVSRLLSKDEPFGSPGNIIGTLAVFVILLALSMPAQSAGFGEANRWQCMDNLHLIGLAFHHHSEESGAFPPQLTGQPPASWRVNLLQYLEHDDIHDGYDLTAEWDSPANLPVARQLVPEFSCPSVPKDSQHRNGLRFTSYALAIGDDTIWPAAGPLHIADITDGAGHTLLVIEACGQHIIWTEPRDLPVGETSVGINLPGQNSGESDGIASSHHPGGAFVTLADGSVRFLSENTDPEVVEALLTADGGEDVGEF